jgi:cytochrome c biogenesis protein CcmG/thiol:disulfide interchange protein DsbE
MRRILALVLAPGALSIAISGCSSGMSSTVHPSSPAGRKPSPLFTLPNLRGGPAVSLAAHRGQPVILNFWAEWCDPCRGEMSVIAHCAATHPDIPVVGIDYQDDPGLAIAFAKSEGANYTLANDSRGTVTESDGAVAIPITVIVDALAVVDGGADAAGWVWPGEKGGPRWSHDDHELNP